MWHGGRVKLRVCWKLLVWKLWSSTLGNTLENIPFIFNPSKVMVTDGHRQVVTGLELLGIFLQRHNENNAKKKWSTNKKTKYNIIKNETKKSVKFSQNHINFYMEYLIHWMVFTLQVNLKRLMMKMTSRMWLIRLRIESILESMVDGQRI